MQRRVLFLGLALTAGLLGCIANPPGVGLSGESGTGPAGSGSTSSGSLGQDADGTGGAIPAGVPVAVVSGSAGSNVILARFKAPAAAVAVASPGQWLAELLVPPAAAEIPGLDTDVVASGSVVVTDVALGEAIATGSTDASGSMAISQVPADKLVKIEVTAPTGTTIAAVVRTPASASAQTFDLGEVGTDHTVAADFFRSGDIDPALLDLVDNRVIAFLADLIEMKLAEDFETGAKTRDQLAAGLKKHKKDKDKPRSTDGNPEDEDPGSTQDPVRKVLNEMGIGEGDKTLLKISVNPALAPSLAKLSQEEQWDVMIRAAFLLQHRDEEESEKADKDEAALEGVTPEKAKAFRISANQVAALVSATKTYTAGDLIRAVMKAKNLETIAIGSTQVDAAAALFSSEKNAKALEAMKAWQKVKGGAFTLDTPIDNPVARILLAFRAGKKSEDALKEALKLYKEQIKLIPSLHLKLARKPMRITSQAEMDALLAALGENATASTATPTPAPTASPTPAPTASPTP